MKDSMVDGGGARVADDRHGGDLTTTRYMNHTGSTSTTTSSTGTSTTTKRVGHRKAPSHNDILNELNVLSGGHRFSP